MSLRSQPFEVIALIAGYLDLNDVYNLSICRRSFRFLAYDQAICKKLLQTTSSSTLEAQQARVDRNYARGLRRLIKRREALRSASPFLTAVVAFADSWLYENGVLCHIRERQLRLLDVHHSSDQELVVEIRKLLDEAIPESRSSRRYKFQLLYQSHGIVSCLYTHARPQLAHWIVVFDPAKGKVLATRHLDSAYKIFVRNDSNFVYYGAQSAVGDDGFRRWVLQGFDIQQERWLEDSLTLPNTVGSDFDSTICAEIIDGYFCALTNNTSFELDRIAYTSYYDFFRFPLHRPSLQYIERPSKRNLFRRQHSEGTIDDRWTFMKIFCDELTGELKIMESRKEWLAGNSTATRTYYTKTLHLTERGGESMSSSSPGDGEEDQYAENDRLAQFLGAASKSNKGCAPSRDPSEVHVGDDGATSVMFTLSKTFIRSYHPLSQAYLDLVDDPHPSEPCDQRIRIRVGTRQPCMQPELGSTCTGPRDSLHSSLRTLQGSDNGTHDQSGVIAWPADAPSPTSTSLHNVLNPPGFAGNVRGSWDQRSLVYATGGGAKGGAQALVLISFDPGIYLKGVRSSDDGPPIELCPTKEDMVARLREAHASLCPTTGKWKHKGRELAQDNTSGYAPDFGREVAIEHKTSASDGHSLISDDGRDNEVKMGTHPWASYMPAQYRAIDLGMHFAK